MNPGNIEIRMRQWMTPWGATYHFPSESDIDKISAAMSAIGWLQNIVRRYDGYCWGHSACMEMLWRGLDPRPKMR